MFYSVKSLSKELNFRKWTVRTRIKFLTKVNFRKKLSSVKGALLSDPAEFSSVQMK